MIHLRALRAGVSLTCALAASLLGAPRGVHTRISLNAEIPKWRKVIRPANIRL